MQKSWGKVRRRCRGIPVVFSGKVKKAKGEGCGGDNRVSNVWAAIWAEGKKRESAPFGGHQGRKQQGN